MPLGPQKLLDHRITGAEVDPPALSVQFIADPTQQVRLAAAGIAKSQQILASIHKRALQEYLDLLSYSQRQTFEIEVLQGLFHRQPRSLDQPHYLVCPADIAFYLGQLMQILLIAQSFIDRFAVIFGVVLTEHRQMKLF
jgi:hypothetical protein